MSYPHFHLILIMVDLVTLQSAAYIAQIVGVVGTLTAAFIAVRGYLNANKRAEEAKKKEQETRNRELETRQAQLFMGVYNQFASKEFVDAWFIYLTRKWGGLKGFMTLWEEDVEFRQSFGIIASWMEGLGTLVREGFLPIRLVAILCSGTVRTFWERMSPFIEETRVEYKRNLSESEYLYHELIKYMAEHSEFKTEAANYHALSKRALGTL
jgi:hypothetical protein